MVQSGEITMRMPCNPGDYGSGMSAFSIPRPRPGEEAPYVTLRCTVRDGRIVPGRTHVDFHPPLDNILWIETTGFSLNERGEISADLRGFWDQAMTRNLLGVDRIPLELNALYDLIQTHSRTMAASAAQFVGTGEPFATGDYQLHIENAVLSRSSLPLPDPSVSLRLAPGTRVTVDGNASGISLRGAYSFDRIAVSRPELGLTGGAVSARGEIRIAMDPTTHAPQNVTIALDDVDVAARSVTMRDESGSTLTLGPTAIDGGALRFNLDCRGSASSARLTIPRTNIDLASAELHPSTGGAITLQAGTFTGGVTLDEHGIGVDIEGAAVAASGTNLATAGGTIRYADAIVSGQGRVVHAAGQTTFTGDLYVRGSVDDASIGREGGAFALDVATGARVDLHVTHAAFGGAAPELTGTGELDVALDGGTIVIPGGNRITLGRGTRAHLVAREITTGATGTTVRGSLEIDANATTEIDPASVSGGGVSITRTGDATGTTRITLADVTLSSDGSFTANGVDVSAHATATRISGRVRTHASDAATRARRSAAAGDAPSVTVAEATHAIPAPVAPDGWAALEAIDSGVLAVRVPLPMELTGEVRLTVEHGRITAVNLALDEASGRRGEVGIPLGLALRDIRNLHVPDALQRIVAWVRENMASTGPNPLLTEPLATLDRYGITIDVTRLHFAAGRPVSLGGASYVVPDPTNNLSLHISGGHARLDGTVSLSDGAILEGGTGLGGLTGRAHLSVDVTGDGASRTIAAELSRLDLTAANARFERSNGDALGLVAPHIDGGSIRLSSSGGGAVAVAAHLPSISGTMASSQLTVRRGDTIVPIHVPGGAFAGEIDATRSSFSGHANIAGATVTTGAFDLPIEGLPLHATSTSATFTGEMTFDSGMRATLHGDLNIEAQIDEGTLGDRGANFHARLASGTSARLHLTDLALGSVEDGATIARGDGNLTLRMRGGHITLPDGIRLDIARGSTGTLRVTSLEQTAGRDLARVRGTLRLRATTTARIPRGGLEIAPGVRLTEVSGTRGEVEIVATGFALDPDGRFSLSNLSIDADVHADSLTATPE